jgi:hypothetical protein
MVELSVLLNDPKDSLTSDLQALFGDRCRSTGKATDNHGRQVDRVRLKASNLRIKADKHLIDYVDRLLKMKVPYLSSGDFSQVFRHPKYPNIAVRLSDAEGDDGYALWMKFVTKNQSNPYVPKVYDRTTGDTEFEKISITFLEFLNQSKLEDFLAFMKKANPKLEHADVATLRDHYYNFPGESTIQQVKKSDRHLGEALQYISDNKMKFEPDLVWRNIMKRPSNNHPVITDPFYG